MLIACQQLFLPVTDSQIATAGEVPPLQTHTPVCINERGLHNSARSKPSTASLLQSDTIVPFTLPDLFSSLAKSSVVKNHHNNPPNHLSRISIHRALLHIYQYYQKPSNRSTDTNLHNVTVQQKAKVRNVSFSQNKLWASFPAVKDFGSCPRFLKGTSKMNTKYM